MWYTLYVYPGLHSVSVHTCLFTQTSNHLLTEQICVFSYSRLVWWADVLVIGIVIYILTTAPSWYIFINTLITTHWLCHPAIYQGRDHASHGGFIRGETMVHMWDLSGERPWFTWGIYQGRDDASHVGFIRGETIPQLWHNTNYQGWDHASTIRGEIMPQLSGVRPCLNCDTIPNIRGETMPVLSEVRPCLNCDTIPTIRCVTMPQLWHNINYQGWDYASTVTQ